MWGKVSEWWGSLDQTSRRWAMVVVLVVVLAGMYFAAHYGLFGWVPGLFE